MSELNRIYSMRRNSGASLTQQPAHACMHSLECIPGAHVDFGVYCVNAVPPKSRSLGAKPPGYVAVRLSDFPKSWPHNNRHRMTFCGIIYKLLIICLFIFRISSFLFYFCEIIKIAKRKRNGRMLI